MKKYAASFCLLLLAASSISAQGWRGIVPLRSTREDVARILGPPAQATRDYFDLGQETAFIIYSDGECGQPGNTGWKVAGGTVVEIHVTPKTKLTLSEVEPDRSKYKKEESKLLGRTFYTDFEKGVSFAVSGEDEVIRQIFYTPTTLDEHLRCPDAAAKQAQTAAVKERYLASLDGKQESRPYRLLDQYADFDDAEEKAHLNNFSTYLKEEPEVLGYVVVYGGRRDGADVTRSHAARVKDYLVKARGIEAERIVTIDGGNREKLTVELYLVPSGAPAPAPPPTLDRKGTPVIEDGRPGESMVLSPFGPQLKAHRQ
ncbi:MAG: hypothetical protein M3416_04250 [Acidobacteriota bacterium]|nr:hypothetical protein [Acidobacteriota bacterium]